MVVLLEMGHDLVIGTNDNIQKLLSVLTARHSPAENALKIEIISAIGSQPIDNLSRYGETGKLTSANVSILL